MANRPLKRYFWRAIVNMTHGRKKSHWQEWIPGLKLVPPTATEPGKVTYRGEPVTQLRPVTDFFAPDELIIIGSGPSLKDQDFRFIDDGTAILLNGAVSLMAKRDIDPAMIMIEDERFIWLAFDEHLRALEKHIPCALSPSVIRAICEKDPSWLEDRPVFLINNLEKPYGLKQRDRETIAAMDHIVSKSDHLFSVDFSKGIVPVGTVAGTAFQLAISLRPRKIGFAGIDLSNTDQPRFNETSGDQAWSGIKDSLNAILGLFDLGRETAERLGIAVENYSSVSALQQIGFQYSPRLGGGEPTNW